MQSHLFAGADISASGMSAERQRMEVVAHNIANANSTNTAEGGPFKRRQLLFSSALDASAGIEGLQGVSVLGIQEDPTPGPKIHNPSHPNADENGMVQNAKCKNAQRDGRSDFSQVALTRPISKR